MKTLPHDYILLRQIGCCAEELLNSIQKAEVVRLSDLYDYIRHKPEIVRKIGTSVDLSRFMRRMYDEHQDIFKAFLPSCIVDTSIYHHYQWRFYPPVKALEIKAEQPDATIKTPKDTFKYFKQSKAFQACNGVMLRSKAELYIYTRLLEIHHFTVDYERPLRIGGEKKYPDFTILNEETYTVFYWEHFGLSDDPDYFEEMNDKLKWYDNAGLKSIDEGGRLIVTLYFNDPHQLTSLVDDAIGKMDQVIIPEGYL
jgi:hypothetical protein